MYTILVVIQVVLAIGIIGLVLIQHGKGADAGAAFGSGASGTVFGSRGSANFLSRSTGFMAALFMGVSLILSIIVARGGATGQSVTQSLVDSVPTEAVLVPAESAPAAPAESSDVPPSEIPE